MSVIHLSNITIFEGIKRVFENRIRSAVARHNQNRASTVYSVNVAPMTLVAIDNEGWDQRVCRSSRLNKMGQNLSPSS